MMSYIRTKYKIYKVKTENEYTYDTATGENIFKSDVIKTARKIEKLFDNIIINLPGADTPHIVAPDVVLGRYIEKGEIISGAIWIKDKEDTLTLKSAAKYKDGKWELL